MVSYLISPASYSKAKNKNTLFTKTVAHKNHNENNETSDVSQLGFNNKRNLTQPSRKWHQVNKCLQKSYLLARRRDGTFYNKKKSLTAIRAAVDRHLRSPPLNNRISFFPLSVRYLFNLCGIY